MEGAFTHISSFLDRKVKRLLLVEDDVHQLNSIKELLSEGGDVDVSTLPSGERVIEELESKEYDCMVFDLMLPDADGFQLLERIKDRPTLKDLPIVIYTSKDLSHKEEQKLRKYAGSIILKSGMHSPERLLNDTALFLHRIEKNLPERAKQLLKEAQEEETALTGKKVLVVDDDVRNIFALTSVLESNYMEVVYAENGKAALEALKSHHDIDAVLMDVMMPEMDGYETMKAIRSEPKHSALPIVAITAKALKDDREKCIAAGASDYLPKPVDSEKLLELLRMWIRPHDLH